MVSQSSEPKYVRSVSGSPLPQDFLSIPSSDVFPPHFKSIFVLEVEVVGPALSHFALGPVPTQSLPEACFSSFIPCTGLSSLLWMS